MLYVVKLSEMKDDEFVTFDTGTYAISVRDFKEKIKNGEVDKDDLDWYRAYKEKWKPDAQRMVEMYIQEESREMYEGWDKIALKHITDDMLEKIQQILEHSLNAKTVTDYWGVKNLEIDEFYFEQSKVNE